MANARPRDGEEGRILMDGMGGRRGRILPARPDDADDRPGLDLPILADDDPAHMPPNGRGLWFIDELAASLAGVPGSPEREHVCTLLRMATRLRLDASVSKAAAQTVRGCLPTILRHVERVGLPGNNPLWIEAGHLDRVEERIRQRAGGPQGSLVAPELAGGDIPPGIHMALVPDVMALDMSHGLEQGQTRALDAADSQADLDKQDKPGLADDPNADQDLAASPLDTQARALPMLDTIGYLLSPDPGNPDHIAIFVAWRKRDGTIHHSYAVLNWDLERFLDAAHPKSQAAPVGILAGLRKALKGYTGGRLRLRRADNTQESARGSADKGSHSATQRDITPLADAAGARLMELADASVPPGLLAEMEIWQGVAQDQASIERAVEHTVLCVMGEHLFLLAVLLMLDSSAIVFEPIADGPDSGVEPRACWLARMGGTRARRWKSPGFSAPMFNGPLDWRAPGP